jgi:hypothetical protein
MQKVVGKRAHPRRILAVALVSIVELLLSYLDKLDCETLAFSLWTDVFAYMPSKSAQKSSVPDQALDVGQQKTGFLKETKKG